MGDTAWIRDIGTLLTGIGATTAAIMSVWNWYSLRKVNREVKAVHISTNSRMDQIVNLVEKSSEAKGALAGHAAGLAEGRAEKT